MRREKNLIVVIIGETGVIGVIILLLQIVADVATLKAHYCIIPELLRFPDCLDKVLIRLHNICLCGGVVCLPRRLIEDTFMESSSIGKFKVIGRVVSRASLDDNSQKRVITLRHHHIDFISSHLPLVSTTIFNFLLAWPFLAPIFFMIRYKPKNSICLIFILEFNF